MRFGWRMSTSGDRWAYFDGSAYLLGVRFFFGRGEDAGVSSVLASFTLARFTARLGRNAASAPFIGKFSTYLNLEIRPLKEDGVPGIAFGAAESSNSCPARGKSMDVGRSSSIETSPEARSDEGEQS